LRTGRDFIIVQRPSVSATSVPSEPFYAYRIANGQFAPIVDVFGAPASWWREHLPEIPDLLMGADYHWSEYLLLIFKRNGAKDETGCCVNTAIKAPASPCIQPPEAPRIAHNRKLTAAHIAAAGSPPRWPKVTEQVECLPLDTGKLFAHAYNPAIVDLEGRIFMAYRYHEGTLASKLATARISETGAVEGNAKLEANGHSLEDPKFFKLGNGELWMSWVEAYWPVKAVSSVRYGGFKGMTLNEAARPVYGQNDGDHTEKSWVFFEHKNDLFFIYQCSPKQIVVRWSGKLEAEHITEGPRWPWGQIRGGTPPIPYEGKLLRFFHSSLNNELELPRQAYYVGACLMNPDPPFATVAVSRKPILIGSSADNLTPEARKNCIHWKAKVCYPGGAVERKDHFLLSLGVNDSSCAIAKIKPEELHL
jgi:predicted GH43/DUF377 family glycosyl hydrolase